MTTDEALKVQDTHNAWRNAGSNLPYPDDLTQDKYIERLREADMTLAFGESEPARKPA